MTTVRHEVSTGPPEVDSPLGAQPSNLRVALVDDHQLFLDSLTTVLRAQPDLEVVGTATTLREALSHVRRWSPDVLILDFEFPDGDAIAHLPGLRELVPDTRVVLLTSHDTTSVERRAWNAGADAYVRKTAGLGEVLRAVRGDVQVPMPSGRPGISVSVRDSEILHMIANGLTNPAIARQLGLSVFTIRNHVAVLCGKFGAHSKLELISRARREGFLC